MRVLFQWHEISPSRFHRERTYLVSLPYFELDKEYRNDASQFIALGSVRFVGHRSGKQHEMRIRLEYPRNFPNNVQRVFDHDKIFTPGSNGHLLSNHELCLTLPERREFSLNTENLTEEVIGAALVWFYKRLLYERTKIWPGPAERHGINAVIDLLVERQIVRDAKAISTWLKTNATTTSGKVKEPNLYAPCLCGSGEKLKFCHREELEPLFHRLRELSQQHLLTDVLDIKE